MTLTVDVCHLPQDSAEEPIGDASRLAPDPVGSMDEQKKDLIKQILELEARYRFPGPKNDPADLAARPMRWLEKLCDMQLLCITLCHAQDRAMSGTNNPRESASEVVARERTHDMQDRVARWMHDRGTRALPSGW